MGTPILATKLNIPPRRPKLVSRPRLVSKLDEAAQQQRLILVSAKAGSGKTTLVSEWVHQQDRPAAWLALDNNDNDPRRFCAYLVEALQQLGATVSTRVLSQLESELLPEVEYLLSDLINGIAGHLPSCLLVIDDYHLIQNEWVHRAIAFFIEHQPVEVTLILVTRVDPPLPLTRLRGRGYIGEIRGGDLQFTAQESLQYLTEIMNLDLAPETVSILDARTEGWIVGLQLAAISMHGREQTGDLAVFIDAFSGTNRYILDYLMEEVLDQQPAAVQDFLLETSILERMCGPLCDAVQTGLFTASTIKSPESAGQPVDSQAMLAQLERLNLFVLPLDTERRWYRYHHLFADLLRSTLRQSRPAAAIRDLHRRASLWHQKEDSLEEAMVHAIAALDYEHAAAMIEENIVSMLSRSEAPVLLGWIEKLPGEIAASRPWIDVYRAYTLALSGRSDEAEQVIDAVEKRVDLDSLKFAKLSGEIAAIRAFLANMHGDEKRAIVMAKLAEEKLPEGHCNARGMTAYALADTYFAKDDMERSSEESLKMLAIGQELGRLLMIITALCDLATTRKAQGQLHQAKELYDRAYRLMAERNSLDSRVRCPYEVGMADLLLEWNQLNAAAEHAATGIAYGQRFNVPSLQTSGNVTLMRIFQIKGDFDNALATLQRAERFIQNHPLQLATGIVFKTERVRFWLAAGDIKTASRWAQACTGGSELEQITLARLQLAKGNVEIAQEYLEQQREPAEAGKRVGRLIEILCLLALAYKQKGETAEAKAVLERALSLAQPEGYLRIFLDMGWTIHELLEQAAADFRKAKSDTLKQAPVGTGYERAILEAFQKEQVIQSSAEAKGVAGLTSVRSTPSEVLTARELEVLRLLVKGISNKEIASRMVVAPSTVKQHLKNIYSKLDVHSRVQAVQRGRELGLV